LNFIYKSGQKISELTIKSSIHTDSFSMQAIITALNEEQGIGLTISELTRFLKAIKILVVDGKSVDCTVAVARNLGADVVYQDGIGKGDALAKGIQCLHPTAEYVLITDADYTYPVDSVPKMLQILKDYPNIGMVCGNRFAGNTDTVAFHDLLSFGNKIIAFMHNLLNGVNLKDPLTGLRVVRADILRNWRVQSKGFDIEVELNHYVEIMGYDIMEIPIQYRPRVGQKKLKISDGATILKRILLEAARSKSLGSK